MTPQGHQVGDVTHERRDVDVIGLAMVVLLLSFVIVICLMVCWAVFHFLSRAHEVRQPPTAQIAGEMTPFPAPRLIEHSGADWKKTRSQQEAELTSYGWVDRPAGIAHIPITHAMELLVERGLPDVGAGQTRLQLMQARPQTNQQPNEPVTAPSPEETP